MGLPQAERNSAEREGMAIKIEWTDTEKYSLAKLESDLNGWCKKNNMSLEEISTDVIVRSSGYLNQCFKKRKLPWNIYKHLVNYIGNDLSKYKIEKQKPPVQEEEQKTEWNLKLLVSEDFGVVRCLLNKGTETIAVGSCDAEIDDGVKTIKSIAVALNRLASRLTKEPGQTKPGEEEKKEPEAVGRKTFKDWVMQYYDSHSDVGRLARFIDEHYEKFPSWGQTKMQRYLQLTSDGAAHRVTFDAYFDHYRKLVQAEERANSERLKNNVMRTK